MQHIEQARPCSEFINLPAGETLEKYVAIVGSLQSGIYPVTFFLDGEPIGAGNFSAGTALPLAAKHLTMLVASIAFQTMRHRSHLMLLVSLKRNPLPLLPMQ